MYSYTALVKSFGDNNESEKIFNEISRDVESAYTELDKLDLSVNDYMYLNPTSFLDLLCKIFENRLDKKMYNKKIQEKRQQGLSTCNDCKKIVGLSACSDCEEMKKKNTKLEADYLKFGCEKCKVNKNDDTLKEKEIDIINQENRSLKRCNKQHLETIQHMQETIQGNQELIEKFSASILPEDSKDLLINHNNDQLKKIENLKLQIFELQSNEDKYKKQIEQQQIENLKQKNNPQLENLLQENKQQIENLLQENKQFKEHEQNLQENTEELLQQLQMLKDEQKKIQVNKGPSFLTKASTTLNEASTTVNSTYSLVNNVVNTINKISNIIQGKNSNSGNNLIQKNKELNQQIKNLIQENKELREHIELLIRENKKCMEHLNNFASQFNEGQQSIEQNAKELKKQIKYLDDEKRKIKARIPDTPQDSSLLALTSNTLDYVSDTVDTSFSVINNIAGAIDKVSGIVQGIQASSQMVINAIAGAYTISTFSNVVNRIL